MATATIVKKIEDIGDHHDPCFYAVELTDGREFRARIGGFENRYAIIVEPVYCTPLEEFAEIIEGCFKKESNFWVEVAKHFRCEKLIKLEFNKVSIFISYKDPSAKKIIKAWKRKQQLLFKGDYYIVGVRKLKPEGKYDGICFVLAASEKEAIKKASKGYDLCECTCFGKYNKIENTFLLKNASEYLEISKMWKIED